MKKAIHQVAADIIKENGSPMSAKEVYEVMVQRNLYEFKAKNPATVVRSQLRRHSKNVETKNKVGSGVFNLNSDGKFELV